MEVERLLPSTRDQILTSGHEEFLPNRIVLFFSVKNGLLNAKEVNYILVEYCNTLV